MTNEKNSWANIWNRFVEIYDRGMKKVDTNNVLWKWFIDMQQEWTKLEKGSRDTQRKVMEVLDEYCESPCQGILDFDFCEGCYQEPLGKIRRILEGK